MRKFIIYLLITFALISCKDRTKDRNQITKRDSSVIDNQEITPDLNQLRLDYISNYDKTIIIEYLGLGKGSEKINFWGKYYCLLDSSNIVPGKYNLDDTTKVFITHNFALDIAITSNGDTIIKKTITKKDIASKLPQYLRDYAVILEPKFEGYDNSKDAFGFSFSVSIPLTDVGQHISLALKRNGQIFLEKVE